MNAPPRVLLGLVVAAHGIRGEVRIKSFAGVPTDIAAYGPLSDESGTQQWRIEVRGESKGAVIARLEGVADRNAAEALKGLRLYVERAALPPTQAREWYQADLIGLEVVGRDGEAWGRVQGFHDYGAGSSMEVVDGKGGIMVVPFTRTTIGEVDLARGSIVIEPPHGLMSGKRDAQERGSEGE